MQCDMYINRAARRQTAQEQQRQDKEGKRRGEGTDIKDGNKGRAGGGGQVIGHRQAEQRKQAAKQKENKHIAAEREYKKEDKSHGAWLWKYQSNAAPMAFDRQATYYTPPLSRSPSVSLSWSTSSLTNRPSGGHPHLPLTAALNDIEHGSAGSSHWPPPHNDNNRQAK